MQMLDFSDAADREGKENVSTECWHTQLLVEKPNRIELNAWQIKDLQVNKKTFKVLEENVEGIFMT